MKWIVIKLLCRIIHNQSIIIRKAKQMASVLEELQNFAASINLALDNIEADLNQLKQIVEEGGTPEQVIAALQPILDRVTAMKEIQPGN